MTEKIEKKATNEDNNDYNPGDRARIQLEKHNKAVMYERTFFNKSRNLHALFWNMYG